METQTINTKRTEEEKEILKGCIKDLEIMKNISKDKEIKGKLNIKIKKVKELIIKL